MGMEAYQAFEEVPHIKTTKDPVAIELHSIIQAGTENIQDLNTGNREWLVSISANNNIGENTWYFVSAIPRM